VSATASSASSPARLARAVASKAREAVPAASLSAAAFLATAAPAHAASVAEAQQFLTAFWEFRTGDPTSFVCLTILPIAGPYVIFQLLIDKKVVNRKEELAAGKWDAFMAEHGLDIDILTLPQLNAFASAAEKGLLDEAMVVEFVRQLELDEKWVKSTIDVEDPRLEQAKLRARAEKIIEMQAARAAEEAKSTANN
jgi:hypothetical protein